MISIRELHKSFGAQRVLCGISLEIEQGETIAIVGPSGTGKSVLLKLVTGFLPADAGEVFIDGRSITAAHRERDKNEIRANMGVLFQGAALFDSMSLLDNVCFPMRYRMKLPRKEVYERAHRALSDVGLEDWTSALPGEVSIGMRKRVGIARALVSDPEIILFDEPNTGLDPAVGQEIYELIAETQERRKFTGIVISHEIPEVFQVCKRVVMLYQGEVQFDGPVEEFSACSKPVVEQFAHGSVEGPIVMS